MQSTGDIRRGQRSRHGANPSRNWACPFFKLDPNSHRLCRKHSFRLVADVRVHIHRKHTGDTTEDTLAKIRGGGARSKTNEERWYDMWSILYPGKEAPLEPYYVGSEFSELSDLCINGFISMEGGSLSPDQVRVLKAYSIYVASVEMPTLAILGSTPLSSSCLGQLTV